MVPVVRASKFVLLLLCVVGAVFILYGISELASTPRNSTNGFVTLTVRTGESVHALSNDLVEHNLIRSGWWFRTWTWVLGREQKVVAGDYSLPANVSMLRIIQFLSGGVSPSNEVNLRFIEGWTLKQMSEYVASMHTFTAAEFLTATTDGKKISVLQNSISEKLWQGKPVASTLEGYLFPDTYRVAKGAPVETLIRKMLQRFEQKFLPDWRLAMSRRGYTVYQAVILASIVEREVSADEDRALVADIFWRRLGTGQGLEADSTINYITGKSTPSVSAKDLAINSPYNTYRYKGLPPGPISNPGESALKAVVYPKPNQFWYFLTTPDGKVIYSKTYADHLKAKNKYL